MSYLFFDIDNTLLSHKTFTIPDSAVEALRRAKENGHHLYIASGRGYNNVKQFLDMGLFDGAVTGSGTCAVVGDKLFFQHNFLPEDVHTIFRLAEEVHAGLSIQAARESWMTEYGVELFITRAQVSKERVREMGIKIFDGSHTEGFCKMDMFFSGNAEREPVIKRIPDTVSVCRTLSEEENFSGCELTPAGNNKGTGALKLLQMLDADPADSYAFGDSENDYELLQVCGTGIAMGNGMKEIRDIADYVTADIEENGIYLAMETYHLI